MARWLNFVRPFHELSSKHTIMQRAFLFGKIPTVKTFDISRFS
jgi:hypothetical protein